MSDLRFTQDHEWVRVEGDVGVVGISDHAQEQLGDIVFIDLPEVGKELSKGDEAAVVESVKAASELYAPVSGEIVEVNESLSDDPAQVNSDPLGGGWIFKIRFSNPSELDGMMDQAAYEDYLETLE